MGGDRFAGEERGAQDRPDILAPTLRLGDAQLHIAAALANRELQPGMRFEAEPSGLKDRRDGGADDIFAVGGELGMPFGNELGQPLPAVLVKRNAEHVAPTRG